MEYAIIAVVGVVTIVAVAAFAKQLGVAAPLVLVLVGIGVSFIPGVPSISVPPWLILGGVLPPLLYAAAIQVPFLDFRRNVGSITTLSVVLVIVSSVLIGLLLAALLPGLDLAAAIALGAVVSPTDIVAAVAVARRIGLPRRIVTMLEGESLVNDASALVMLKAAIGATGATISVWSTAGQFALSVVIAIAAGLIVGAVTVFVRSKLRDPVLDTAISFAVPFLAYLPASATGASGVLAVVVAGIYSGHHGAQSFTAQSRISEHVNWRTVQFLLENGVFLLMGLQLRQVIGSATHHSPGVLVSVAIGLLVALALLVVRGGVVSLLLVALHRRRRRITRDGPKLAEWFDRLRLWRWRSEGARRRRAEVVAERRSADIDELEKERIGVQGGLVISWAGMRGVVTIAAAQSLPGETPYRAELVLIAFTVAIATLLLQGGTLPAVIRLLGVAGTDVAAHRRELAELLDEISHAGLATLDDPRLDLPEGEEVDAEVVERLRREVSRRRDSARERAADTGDEDAFGPHRQYHELMVEVLDAERGALLEARSRGSYPSAVLAEAQRMLDLDQTRLQQTEAGDD